MEDNKIIELDGPCQDGCYMKNDLDSTPTLSFDLRKAANYVTENNLDRITDEVKEMFKI